MKTMLEELRDQYLSKIRGRNKIVLSLPPEKWEMAWDEINRINGVPLSDAGCPEPNFLFKGLPVVIRDDEKGK